MNNGKNKDPNSPNKPGSQPPGQQKKKKSLLVLIVEAGIARSIREALAMFTAGEICYQPRDGEKSDNPLEGSPLWLHGEPCSTSFLNYATESTSLYDKSTMVVHRSKCPECRKKPLVFSRIEKKPAISSATHSRVLDEYEDCEKVDSAPFCSPDARLITQADLEVWLLRRRHFAEIDEPIAIAISRGATVELGVHSADLVPMRDEDGRTVLKLVIR